MSINLFKALYVCRSARYAVLTCDEGKSFVLGYFKPPYHAWTHVATFEEEASAQRAFGAYNRAASIWTDKDALAA
jgi:hypothetical protein